MPFLLAMVVAAAALIWVLLRPRWGLAIPSFVWYLLFFIAPIGIIVLYSFGAKDSSKLIPVNLDNLSLENYRRSITGDNFDVFWGTLKIAVTATLMCLLVGFPVSYFIAFKASEKWRAILLALVVIPSFTSFLIRTIAWRIPLSPNGELSKWLQDLGWLDGPIDILGTRAAVFLAIVYNYVGFMVLPMFVALDRIDPALREASKDLGGTRTSTFASVTLPLSGPGVIAGVLLTFIPMCGDYITATVLGGAKGFMVGALIDSQFRGAQNWPQGSAMAVVMIVMVLLSLAAAGLILMVVRLVLLLLRPVGAHFRRGQVPDASRAAASPMLIIAGAAGLLIGCSFAVNGVVQATGDATSFSSVSVTAVAVVVSFLLAGLFVVAGVGCIRRLAAGRSLLVVGCGALVALSIFGLIGSAAVVPMLVQAGVAVVGIALAWLGVPGPDRPPRLRSRVGNLLHMTLAVWAALVLVFLFIPILLVVRHSFNNGPSFSIWSGEYSTVWWGGPAGKTKSGLKMQGLFDFGSAGPMLLRFVIIIGIGVALPYVWKLVRGEHNRHLRQWSVLAAFVLAVVVNGLMTDWYLKIFQQAGVGEGMRGSFLAAFGGTLIAVVIGGLCGVALARHPGKWAAVMMGLLFLILVTPEIMDAIALAGWMQRVGGPLNSDTLGVPFGVLRLWIGQSLYASAVVTLIVRARLAGVDTALEEAAGDLGAPPARAFRQVTLPLISPALIAGGLLSFTLCLDNTVISSLISGASSTFPVSLISATKSEIKPFWGVGSVVLFVMTMALLAFVARVLKKSGDSSGQIAATLGGG